VFLIGCAPTEHHETFDVSHDPRFQEGYHSGTTYRLNSTSYLICINRKAPLAARRYQIQSQVWYDRWAAWARPQLTIAVLPAGTTFHVNQLQYTVDYYTYPLIYLGFQMPDNRPAPLEPLSTLSYESRTWENVIPPIELGGGFERIDDAILFAPDRDLASPIAAAHNA
jgi:hypothetical protein